jgi:hypothetical protein
VLNQKILLQYKEGGANDRKKLVYKEWKIFVHFSYILIVPGSMVKPAVKTLNEYGGSSLQAIKK